MDAPKVESWQELIDLSRDRTRWREIVWSVRTTPSKKFQTLVSKLLRRSYLQFQSPRVCFLFVYFHGTEGESGLVTEPISWAYFFFYQKQFTFQVDESVLSKYDTVIIITLDETKIDASNKKKKIRDPSKMWWVTGQWSIYPHMRCHGS